MEKYKMENLNDSEMISITGGAEEPSLMYKLGYVWADQVLMVMSLAAGLTDGFDSEV